MRHSIALLSSTAVLSIAASQGALADVKPADVWANVQAYTTALGGDARATLTTSGNTTSIEDFSAVFAFPFGVGQMVVTSDPMDLIDNGDGSVTVRYRDGTNVALSIDFAGQATGQLGMRLNGGGMDMVATGDPGDITYSYDIPSYGLEITEFSADGAALEAPDLQMLRELDLSGSFAIEGNTGTMRVVEGDMIDITADGGFSSMSYSVSFAAGELISGKQEGTAGKSQSVMRLALPAGGSSVMALHEALKSGMMFDVTSSTVSTTTNQELVGGGEIMSYTRDETGPTKASVTFDADGIRMAGTIDGYTFDTLDPTIPFPISGTLGLANFKFEAPISGSDAPQPFVLGLDLEDLTIDESVWGLFDPAGALPRDPISQRFSAKGEMGTTIDLLDFAALMALEDSGDVPFSIHALTLEEYYLSALGADVSSKGDFTFDMNDLETFDGLPAPTGTLDVSINGANGLIDTLISMGLLPEEDAMGARMMMGIFARPGDGEDNLVSKIEIDGATGSVSANGQRLR